MDTNYYLHLREEARRKNKTVWFKRIFTSAMWIWIMMLITYAVVQCFN